MCGVECGESADGVGGGLALKMGFHGAGREVCAVEGGAARRRDGGLGGVELSAEECGAGGR